MTAKEIEHMTHAASRYAEIELLSLPNAKSAGTDASAPRS